jgi:hypothetical protein
MHECQKFREDWTIGLAEDSGDCEECRSFCEEAQFILAATGAEAQRLPEFSEAYWDRFEDRLHTKLVRVNVSNRFRFYMKWSVAAATAAALVIVLWGGSPISPHFNEANAATRIEFVDDHIQGLNPTVVSFLSQSELFLRSFTKIDPSYVEDLSEAQIRAQQSLAEIETQKLRAADFVPVQMVLDEYESVLREIKNVDSAEDVSDIQSRIRKSGLISSMKAYQPQVVLVGHK